MNFLKIFIYLKQKKIMHFFLMFILGGLLSRFYYLKKLSPPNIIVNKEFKEFELAFQYGKNPPNKLNYIKENIINKKSFDYQINKLSFPINEINPKKIKIEKLTNLNNKKDIYFIKYKYLDQERKSYAYFIKSLGENKCNYIIYPGSGFFEPYKLYKGLSKYQQNLVNYRNEYCNTYIIIPDGEDKLSINFKGKSLPAEILYPTIINKGGNLTSVHLLNLLAWSKFLANKNKPLYTAGASKGGILIFTSSKLIPPYKSLIASGWSESFKTYERANINQFITPLAKDLYNRNISKKTTYIFTYGEKELDVYGWEYLTKYTCNIFKKNQINIICLDHDKGHVVTKESVNFLFE